MATRQGGVFTLDQARAAGWTSAAVRYAVRSGRLDRIRRGIYRRVDTQGLDRWALARREHAAPAIAASLAVPGAVASHSSAAVLLDLPLVFVPRQPCISVVPWHTGEVRGVHVHRTTSMLQHFVPIAGLLCTSVARTVVDLAREHGTPSALVAADRALSGGLTSAAELARTLAECRRWPGVRAARNAIELADGRAESPLESLSRLKLLAFGVPRPELQCLLGTRTGAPIGRVDFYWDEFGVVGEADGLEKYDGRLASLRDEKVRQERLEATGLVVVRWGWADLRDFDAVTYRLRRAFAEGQRRSAGACGWTRLPRASLDFDPRGAA